MYGALQVHTFGYIYVFSSYERTTNRKTNKQLIKLAIDKLSIPIRVYLHCCAICVYKAVSLLIYGKRENKSKQYTLCMTYKCIIVIGMSFRI